MARVLVISSHVARGQVGLTATVPALQWFSHEVWPLPTVLLASRPGLGQLRKHELPADELAGMLSALEHDGCFTALDAVMTGYFPSEHSVAVAAQAIARVKAANPRALVMVDPILGDAGRLYVAQKTAEAMRHKLLPLADVATPNLFELAWLTGSSPARDDQIVEAARGLGPRLVAVTSASETPQTVGTLLISAASYIERTLPRRANLPNGAGDLFAGLLLGGLLTGASDITALDTSLACLDRVLAASSNEPVLRLSTLNDGKEST